MVSNETKPEYLAARAFKGIKLKRANNNSALPHGGAEIFFMTVFYFHRSSLSRFFYFLYIQKISS